MPPVPPARIRRGLVHVAVALGYTPLHLAFALKNGMATPRMVLASALENAMAFQLFVHLLRATTTAPARTRPQEQRKLLSVGLVVGLVCGHGFVVAAQVTAVALMQSKMNSDFIFNLVHAVKTGTWSETDAKYFFPSVLCFTLAVMLVWLWWGVLQNPNTVGCPLPCTAHKDKRKHGAHTSTRQLSLALGGLLLVRNVFLYRGYSPVSNTLHSIAMYTRMRGQSRFQYEQRQNPLFGRRGISPKTYKYNFTELATDKRRSALKKKKNVVLIINDSLGNALLKTPDGLASFSFYQEVVRQHPHFYDFSNVRATSTNTNTAATAALLGYYVAASDVHPEVWNYFDLPNLFTMGRALGYRLALFAPYETELWWPFTGFYEDRFDVIVSRTTLHGKVANDMGMDDRLVTTEVLAFLEEQAATQDEEDHRPFVLVVMWNNMHRPFLINDKYVTPTPPPPLVAADFEKKKEEEKEDKEQDPDLFSQLMFPDAQHKRAMGALKITDDMMRDVYATLNSTGLLAHTIITFQADHGERAGSNYVSNRLAEPSSLYLATPFWMYVPPAFFAGREEQREVLRGNRDRLVSNLDMMPTVTELLGWETTEHMFHKVPTIFKHGLSLLRPVGKDRLTCGWQGRPLVDSCDWQAGFLSNATHTLILRAGKNDIVVEALDETRGEWTKVTQRWQLKDLPEAEQAQWVDELKRNHKAELAMFEECFFDYI